MITFLLTVRPGHSCLCVSCCISELFKKKKAETIKFPGFMRVFTFTANFSLGKQAQTINSSKTFLRGEGSLQKMGRCD